MVNNMDFYDYLRSQFNNLQEAKIFYKKWWVEWEQEIPDYNFDMFSLRSMAYHISKVLENEEPDNNICTSYIDTKYGSEIYLG